MKFLLILTLLTSCSTTNSRLKMKSPQSVTDQLEQLSLYGYWKSKQGYLHIDCAGNFDLKYNYNNLKFNDQNGYISELDSIVNQLTIKNNIKNSKYLFKKSSKNKLEIEYLEHKLANKLKGYFQMLLSKSKNYDCEKIRKMNPIELAKFMLINNSDN